MHNGAARRVWQISGGLSLWFFVGAARDVVCLAEEMMTASTAAGRATAASQPAVTNAPGDAQEVAPALRAVLETFATSRGTQQRLQQLRTAGDQVRTMLVTVKEETGQLAQHREKVADQLLVMERQQQERIAALRKELEARLQEELTLARQQISAQLEEDVARQLHEFESRQRELIEQSLDEDLRYKEREIQQLTQEIEIQTRELVDRLGRLDADSAVTKSLEQSTNEIIAKRKADLYARRQQVQAQRDAVLGQRRNEFSAKTKQKQQLELQRRVMLKEAGLRQAMADVLQKAQAKETNPADPVRRALEEIDRRRAKLAQQETSLRSQLDTLTADLTATTGKIELLNGQEKASMARLEAAFERSGPGLSADALAWFGQVVKQAPQEAAAELGLLQQRLVVKAEQERQLREQHRMLRERQLALQVSHQVEQQYQQVQDERQRELDERSRRADELLVRAKQLQARGEFNKALELVAEAQTFNAPQPIGGSIAMLRDEIMSEKGQAVSQARYSYVESVFSNAMQAFQSGDYEQAIKLFERVIAQEEKIEGGRPSPAPSRPATISAGASPAS